MGHGGKVSDGRHESLSNSTCDMENKISDRDMRHCYLIKLT